MANFRALYDSKFMANWDLPEDEDTILTIKSVVQGVVHDRKKGEDVHKPLIYFEGRKKGWLVPKSVGTVVEGMYGEDYKKWVGKKIAFYVGRGDYFGKTNTACIRVRPEIPK